MPFDMKRFMDSKVPADLMTTDLPNRLGRSLIASIAGWLLMDFFYPKPSFVQLGPSEEDCRPLFTWTAKRFKEEYTFTLTPMDVASLTLMLRKAFSNDAEQGLMVLSRGLVAKSSDGQIIIVPPWAIKEFLTAHIKLSQEIMGFLEAAKEKDGQPIH